MTDNVVMFDGPTKLDLPPERIIGAASEVDLESVIIVGQTKGGELYLASSDGDLAAVHWWLTLAAKRVVDMAEGEE